MWDENLKNRDQLADYYPTSHRVVCVWDPKGTRNVEVMVFDEMFIGLKYSFPENYISQSVQNKHENLLLLTKEIKINDERDKRLHQDLRERRFMEILSNWSVNDDSGGNATKKIIYAFTMFSRINENV